MGKKTQKIAANMKKGLPVLKVVGGVSILALGLAGYALMSSNDVADNSEIQQQAAQTRIDPVSSDIKDSGYIPGKSGEINPRYKKLLEEQNKKKAEQERAQGKSHIDTPLLDTGKTSVVEKDPELLKRVEEIEKKMEFLKAQNDALQERIDEAALINQGQSSNQGAGIDYYEKNGVTFTSNELRSKRQQALESELKSVLDEPLFPKPKTVDVALADNRVQSSGVGQAGAEQSGGQTQSSSGQPQSASAGVSSGNALVHTGDMLYATLDLTANSDVPGPIMATIQQGKLRGAKVMGSFEVKDEYLVLNFNRMTLPDGTVKNIEAVAVDPMLATVGQADDVDRHIPMKLAAVFGAAWLQGVGEAMMASKQVTPVGGASTDSQYASNINTPAEIAVAGLAKVGEKLSQILEPYANRKTTVVKYAGSGMALLFTQNVE